MKMLPRFKIQYPMKNQGKGVNNWGGIQAYLYGICVGDRKNVRSN